MKVKLKGQKEEKERYQCQPGCAGRRRASITDRPAPLRSSSTSYPKLSQSPGNFPSNHWPSLRMKSKHSQCTVCRHFKKGGKKRGRKQGLAGGSFLEHGRSQAGHRPTGRTTNKFWGGRMMGGGGREGEGTVRTVRKNWCSK